MRKFFVLLCALFFGVAVAETITVNWYNEGSLYDTTTCTVGGDINLPTAPTKRGYTFLGWNTYTPIEYIESTGTQWIDTNIRPIGTAIGFETEFALKSFTNDKWIFGYGGGAALQFGIYGGVLRVYNTDTIITFGNPDLYWHTVKYNSPYDGTQYDNQTLYSYNSGWISTLDNKMYLFARSYNNNLNGNISVKIKYFKIWQNETLVRDMVPILDSNGVACMYDKVSKTFFYNAGTGDFVAGPVIAE